MYTNPQLDTLRDSIARSLAWGGLEQHVPEWKRQPDTCMMSCINIAAMNFNAPRRLDRLAPPPCDTNKIITLYLDQTKDLFLFAKPKEKTKPRK